MALNGLDSKTVAEAYKAALAEPAGWLLLNYTSRDEVDVYQRGNGGLGEAIEALSEYPTKSPLYGFLNYRNKKIVLKYIPEGTSRLLQARTSVHWSAVTDTFSPHDASLTATKPDEIDDISLSGLCGLAPDAPPAPSISDISAPSLKTATPDPYSVEARAQTSRNNFYDETSSPSTISNAFPPGAEPLDLSGALVGSQNDYGKTADDRPRTQPHGHARYEPRSRDALNLAAFLNDVPPPSASVAAIKQEPELREFAPSPDSSAYRPSNDLEPPKTSHSSRSVRPSTSDLWRSFKPKLKLGPRPVDNQASPMPSAVRQKLPSGLKVKSRKSDKDKERKREKSEERPKSRKSEKSVMTTKESIMTSADAPPRISSRQKTRSPEDDHPLPPLPHDPASEERRSRAETASPTAYTPTTTASSIPTSFPVQSKAEKPSAGYSHGRRNPSLGIDTNTAQVGRMDADTFALLSPEKQRLMKALELRKRQMRAANQSRASNDDAEGPALKTDSGVDIEESRAPHDPGRNRPRPALATMPSTSSLVSKPPPTPRRHNPALQSHPIGDMESFASPPLQPPLPPPPADLKPQSRDRSITRKELPPTPKSADIAELPPRLTEDERRRGLLKPITTDRKAPSITPSADNSNTTTPNAELMMELESATVQEAKPMPIAPKHIANGSGSRAATPVMIERSGSRKNPAELPAQVQAGSGPSSPPMMRPSTATSSVAERSNSSKRVNVSTGISRRIHALAELQGRDDGPMSPHSAVQSQQDGASFLATTAMPHSYHSQSILARSYDESRGSSPPPSTRRGYSRRPSQDSQRTADTATGRKRDTYSVTAHIQRNPQAGRPIAIEEEGYDYGAFDNAQQLHSRTVSRTSTNRTDGQRPGSSHTDRPVSRGSTITSFTKTSLDVWRSGGNRRHQGTTRQPMGMPNMSLDRVDEVSEPRTSRTSKLFKQISSFAATKQKPPSVAESMPTAEERRMLSPPRPSSIIVGDLNVQFPDTLLWKRRWVEVDGNGNLVLSASPSHDRPNGSRKKYHLSDFRTPILPGQGRQELPHSINLDFVGGGGSIQLATEDPVGQASILRRLGDVHRAWLYYES